MSSAQADRARRMLALLRHLEPDTEIELEELAALVGTTPEIVATDIGTLSLCGVAPYDPLNLVSAFVDEGRVIVMGPPPALDRPVRLSSPEARALAAALQAAGFEAHDSLTERLMQGASLEFSAEQLARRLRAEGPAPSADVYEALASSVANRTVVSIEYQRAGDSTVEQRTIEPLGIYNDRGTWYANAYCRSAQDTRTFRLDRIRRARLSDEVFEPGGPPSEARAFDAAGLPKTRLVFRDSSEFSEREWPGSAPAGDVFPDGSLAVDVPYSGTPWIARQVCARLGSVIVETPDEVRSAVAKMASTVASEIGPDAA